MGKTAIILGATGLTGGLLLSRLLEDIEYSKVKVFGRRSCGIKHFKIEEYIIDLLELKKYKQEFTADVVFCCIGTTKAKSSDKEVYRAIDYGIPVNAAKLCQLNVIRKFIVISAIGADPNSKVFYNRLKGEMEQAILKFKIPQTYILQPSLIVGPRDEQRLGERMAKYVLKALQPILKGPLSNYQSISAKSISSCMVYLAKYGCDTVKITSQNIKIIAKSL
ncbi:MAG: nucleoside-diphosphate sugar epimerase [Bacteroidetes bacterium MedPE-SWsnd-G2]|nr:MAG: nucleoside-diphosphate sugar epimerase [Bacteroidetes bacterium MedPE-SWsnd-G2]